MSNATTLSDLLKSLPAVTDTAGKSVLLADTSGAMSKQSSESFLPVTVEEKSEGAYLTMGNGINLCFAYSQSNHFIFCVYLAVTFTFDFENNRSPFLQLGNGGGLNVIAVNAFGTTTFAMGSGTLPDDIVTKVVKFKI